jgi:hypothetical protein
VNHLKLAGLLFLIATSASAQERPPSNYENWNVCPFECCTYREWVAEGEISVHASRNDKSPILFRLRQGEPADALTGVVVTVKPGVVKVDKSVQDGFVKGSNEPQLKLSAGDTLYMLSPLGEGAYLFWYHGKVYESGAGLEAMPGVDASGSQMVWWKLIRNKAGKSGWTQSSSFTNVDACG